LEGVDLNLELSETSSIKRHRQSPINIAQRSKGLIMAQFEEEILAD